MSKRKYVSVSGDSLATVDDVMQLVARLSYLDLIDFAGEINGDADKIADAAAEWLTNHPGEEAK